MAILVREVNALNGGGGAMDGSSGGTLHGVNIVSDDEYARFAESESVESWNRRMRLQGQETERG